MTRVASTGTQTDETLTVEGLVSATIERRHDFLDLAARHGSPLYVIEEATLLARARRFSEAFRAHFPDVRVFFPLKTNSHPWVAGSLVAAGLGIEASSGLELDLAISVGAPEILFNGPAKTEAELRSAIQNRDRVTVILDSATEFDRLETLAASENAVVRAGVRLTVDTQPLWRKFGVPPSDLASLLARATTSRHVRVRGLHFHTSWNMDPSAQATFIRRLGETVARLPAALRSGLEFLDIGGGFWPPQGEWLPVVPNDGEVRDSAPAPPPHGPFHKTNPAAPIAEFADAIAEALDTGFFRHTPLRLCVEPGRWICNDAACILLTVLDRKDGIAITDGGTNAVGWERFEHEYFPVINLSRPDAVERPCLVLGSLCTPHDVWGRSYFGTEIRIGDALLIPHQGAYTHSLRQRFIKPLPTVVFLGADGVVRREGDPAPCP